MVFSGSIRFSGLFTGDEMCINIIYDGGGAHSGLSVDEKKSFYGGWIKRSLKIILTPYTTTMLDSNFSNVGNFRVVVLKLIDVFSNFAFIRVSTRC
jgi:hypothetical protein